MPLKNIQKPIQMEMEKFQMEKFQMAMEIKSLKMEMEKLKMEMEIMQLKSKVHFLEMEKEISRVIPQTIAPVIAPVIPQTIAPVIAPVIPQTNQEYLLRKSQWDLKVSKVILVIKSMEETIGKISSYIVYSRELINYYAIVQAINLINIEITNSVFNIYKGIVKDVDQIEKELNSIILKNKFFGGGGIKAISSGFIEKVKLNTKASAKEKAVLFEPGDMENIAELNEHLDIAHKDVKDVEKDGPFLSMIKSFKAIIKEFIII
jgi:hypothetical protein